MQTTDREIIFLNSIAEIISAAGNDRLADAIWSAAEHYSRSEELQRGLDALLESGDDDQILAEVNAMLERGEDTVVPGSRPTVWCSWGRPLVISASV